MKRRHAAIWMFGVCAVGLPWMLHAPAAEAQTAPGAVLRLEVSAFRNTTGALSCRLFSQPADFPDGEGAVTVRVAIDGKQAVCAFANVRPGTYAVAVVHDENGNGRMDRNLFGVPSEGYGVSNNHTYSLSSPKWDESKFTVAANERSVLPVSLRY